MRDHCPSHESAEASAALSWTYALLLSARSGHGAMGRRRAVASPASPASLLHLSEQAPAAPEYGLLQLVPTSSEVGVDEGGCSATRARGRCACRWPRIGPAASTPATPVNAHSKAARRRSRRSEEATMRRAPRLATSRRVASNGGGPAWVQMGSSGSCEWMPVVTCVLLVWRRPGTCRDYAHTHGRGG